MAVLSEHNIGRFMAGDLSVGSYDEMASRITDFMGFIEPAGGLRVLRALVAIESGVAPDLVARHLDWRDFESFCARLIKAKGFSVTLDLRLKQPKAQIDILARSSSISLVVDCKHWARERGPAALSAVVERQKARALLVRRKMKEVEPMAVVVLSLANEQARYVDGAAVVPVRTLGDFLDRLPSYSPNLALL